MRFPLPTANGRKNVKCQPSFPINYPAPYYNISQVTKTRIRGNRIFLHSDGLLISRYTKTCTNILKSRISSSNLLKITKIDISKTKNIQNRFRTLITRRRHGAAVCEVSLTFFIKTNRCTKTALYCFSNAILTFSFS